MNEQPRKILVVDDEEVTIELAKTFLERHGFVVVSAFDGKSAIEVAQKERPDLVLLDIMLPDIDGFEVCRQIKESSNLKYIPVLIFTARDFDRDIERGKAVGADEYIVKPFAGKDLVATIRKHLGLTT